MQKEILLYGSWTAREETAGYWSRAHVNFVKTAPQKIKQRVLAADFAFTAPSEANKSPDSTAFVLMSKDLTDAYTVEHVETLQDKVHVVEAKLFELAELFGRETIIAIPQDPNAQAGAYARGLQKRLAERGFTCKLMRPVKSKLVRFQPFSAVTQGGFVSIVEAPWNKTYFDQLEIFDGSGKSHDDMVDATSDAFLVLNQTRTLGAFALPDFSQTTAFGFQPSALPTDMVVPL